MADDGSRSALEVLDDHLRKRLEDAFEEDLLRNYAGDVVLMTAEGVFRGHDGVRELYRRLQAELPQAQYVYRTRLVEGEMGFLEWAATARHACVDDGADSYLVRDGLIVVQTIHFTVRRLVARAQPSRALVPVRRARSMRAG